jgi:hypothetical protein
VQSSENTTKTRSDLDLLIRNLQVGGERMFTGRPGAGSVMLEAAAALAAERDRADQAEAALGEAWDEGVSWAQESESDFPKSSVGNPYRPEATA